MIDDIRYAFRLLVRDLRFTCAALISLALGIGAATGVFSVVDRILFRALPYADDGRLVSIGLAAPMLFEHARLVPLVPEFPAPAQICWSAPR